MLLRRGFIEGGEVQVLGSVIQVVEDIDEDISHRNRVLCDKKIKVNNFKDAMNKCMSVHYRQQ